MKHSQQSALERYNERFDAEQYENIAGLLASNRRANRDDPQVIAALNLLIDLCLELCGSTPHEGSWHQFAVYCGENNILKFTVDAIVQYLRRFAENDMRIDDFDGSASAIFYAYGAQTDGKQSAAHANGVHSWHGRAAYELLVSSDYFTQAAIQLLAHGDQDYIREKLQAGLERVTSALYEGVRGSKRPGLFNFKSIYFPDEWDT